MRAHVRIYAAGLVMVVPDRDHNFWFARRYFGYDLEMTPPTRSGQRPLERGITMKATV